MRVVIGVVCVAVCAGALAAGPLNPPAGPILSTPGPEPRTPISQATTPGDADAQFVINQAGSYYLTGNVTGTSMLSGIRVQTRNVTIDLRGFRVQGTLGSQFGIVGTTNAENMVVRNGQVRFAGADGIFIDAPGAVLDRITVSESRNAGIRVGEGALVRSCTAQENGRAGSGEGIVVGPGSSVIDCLSNRNTNDAGFVIGERSLVMGCMAYENSTAGFEIGAGSALVDCYAHGGRFEGFEFQSACSFNRCWASGNGQAGFAGALSFGGSLIDCTSLGNRKGIEIGDSWSVRGCTVIASEMVGIQAGEAARIESCLVAQNGIPSAQNGVLVGSDSRVDRCIVRSNGGEGIRLGTRSVVTGSSILENGGVGIWVLSLSNVAGNVIASNGTDAMAPARHGIQVFGDDNMIDSNKVSGSQGSGIQIDGGFNFVVRNVSTPDVIVDNGSSNRIGTISSDPVGAGPWDNFNY